MNINYIIIYFIIYIILSIYIYNFKENCNKKIYNEINNENKEFLNGYWSSDNEFAKRSEIDEMILNIDIQSMTGFLVIIVDNKIVINDDFDIILNTNCNEIEFISDNINFIWNEKKFKMHLIKSKGLLNLYHNDILYGCLYKDNKISSIFNK